MLCNKIKETLYKHTRLSSNPPIKCKADSGATRHYFRPEDTSALINVAKADGPTVMLPDQTALQANACGRLPISELSTDGNKVHIIPGIKTASLISLGQLCDDNCIVELRKEAMNVTKNDKIILRGTRNHLDGLWDIDLNQTQLRQHHCNIIVDTKNISDLIAFYHECLFCPTKSTWLRAIKGKKFPTWPGLTAERVTKFFPTTAATAHGHLDQEQQNLRSTKNIIPFTDDELQDINDDLRPQQEADTAEPQIMCQVIPFTHPSKAYADLTGRFPYKSSRGNQYILVFYNYDANYINAIAVKSRQASELKNAFVSHTDTLQRSGIVPTMYILDNEISNDLKLALTKYDITYQLVPPAQHRRNAAERAIRTFKNHFLSGLASLPPSFPISEWDRLLEKALLTLNLLRNARKNPKLSAHAYVHGIHDFNSHPLAPPGSRVVAHEKPTHRKTWATHGKDGWYVGPATEHYRCVRVYLKDTGHERICDTVQFLQDSIPLPAVKTTDYLLRAADDIVTLLKQPQKLNLPHHPSLQMNDALRATADLLQRAATKPTSPETTPSPTQPAVISTPLSPPRTTPPHIITDDNPPLPESPRVAPAAPRVVPVIPQMPPTPQQVAHVSTPSKPPYLRCMQATNFNQRRLNMLIATELYGKYMHHVYDQFGNKETIESLLNGPDAETWRQSVSNEFGRLAQGNDKGVDYTDTIDFITKQEVPTHKKVTYAHFRFDHRPLKPEPFRARLVVGGDRLDYTNDASSPAASLLETKIIINSVISDAADGARFMALDLKDFFLASPIPDAEYMKLPLGHFPADIIDRYKLNELVADDGFVYIKIKKGMYGLKQAAILAYEYLITNLKESGYAPIPHSVGMWQHSSRRTKFCLCVDDFGIKYYSKDDATHLIDALKSKYKLTIDWAGEYYCGLTFKWNYAQGYVDVTMPGYIEKVLLKYFGNTRKIPTNTPFKYHMSFTPGSPQFALPPDSSPTLDKSQTKIVQAILGSLLYYARAIEHPMLTTLNELSAEQAIPTENTMKKIHHLLQYAATFPDSILRFHASDMIMNVDSDAAYLVMPKARSRIAGYYYFSDANGTYLNAPFLIICKTLKHVVSSAAEAETGGLFINGQEIISIRRILHSLGHPQPPTPLKTDNSTSYGFVHNNIKLKKAKAWDMRFHWLREKMAQNNLRIFWEKGSNNFADYFTKHHSTKHHEKIRPLIFKTNLLMFLTSQLTRVC